MTSSGMESKYEYVENFRRLLQEKITLDEQLEAHKKTIESVMTTFPDGIALGSQDDLQRLYSQCYRFMPPQQCSVLLDPEIWSIICDASDTIIAVSENLRDALGYPSKELLGAYKGKLWAERPDGSSIGSSAYLIYEVKQKHFHGTHEDALIARDGRVVTTLQHRLDLKIAGRAGTAGYLYLILDIRKNKSSDYALSVLMDAIEHDLQLDTPIELTQEIRRFLVKDLIRTREYIESVLTNAIDGILVTSPAGLIIGANTSFKKLVGYTERELSNQPITMVTPNIGSYPMAAGGAVTVDEQYFIDMASMIDSLFQNGEIYGFRQYFKRKDGHLIPTEVNISLLRNKRGEITGFIRNIHDLSEKERLQKEIVEKQHQISLLKKEIIEYYGPENIVGKSPAMQTIFRVMTKVADTDSTVLLQGESGTGKELVAHALYGLSPRKGGPFIVLNCGAIPQNLLESELFGHVKGAFTGAIRDKKGLFEEAGGGVIFLDEIGELPLEMQVKLLRAIQEREIRRVGENQAVKIDVRIIAATHKDLLEETRRKNFREDLYYRINVVTIKLPPLRDRAEDIPLLIDFLIKKNRPGREVKFSREAMKLLLGYTYPGNVRELENIIERAMILCENDIIQPEDLPPELAKAVAPQRETPHSAPAGLRLAVSSSAEITERAIIEKALEQSGHNRAVAAKLLKIGRTSLYRKMKKFGLE